MRTLTCLTILSSLWSVPALALELNVSDYFHKKDLGLFFTKPEIGGRTVYYVPQTQESLRDTGTIATIQGVVYNVYEASVAFPTGTDLDEVRRLKPEWADAGFLRTEVEALEHCRVSRPATPEFPYLMQIDDVWKKTGLISSTQAFLCKVKIAIKPGDAATKAAMTALAENGELIDRGLASFTLNVTAAQETVLNLSPSFNYLREPDKADLLVDVSRETALVALGSSFSTLDDASFARVLQYVTTAGANELLTRYFVVKNNRYTLRRDAVNTQLTLTGPARVVIDL
ncbi:hypothetical protein [Oligoflexus tunisiensis]|uniref:hypothetical protein n=1 Tax=Oligoflexus tunisiensis TaxID=708132 RepID=UPI00114C9EAF|nr:hypothetical protein [Oligoflexus tunisiensis]